MKPNIFKFATKELTNDAMICWLVSWANYSHEEYKELRNLSTDIINLFTDRNIKDIKSVDIKRQYKNIDILVNINNTDLIIIEDKIDTTEHSNQLSRYKKEIENDYEYKDFKKHYVYLKIGNESYYEDIEKIGYKKISRQMLLHTLLKYNNIKNSLLEDYSTYLQERESDFNYWKTQNIINKWSFDSWKGYYDFLQKKKDISNRCWSYVSNKSGGFLAFYWNEKEKIYNGNIPYNIYLQIEAKPKNEVNTVRVAYKVKCTIPEYRSEIRNYVWENLKNINNNHIKKTIFKKGEYMTIAEIDNINTVEILNKSIEIAESVIEELSRTLN